MNTIILVLCNLQIIIYLCLYLVFIFFKMVLIYKSLIFMVSLYAVTTKITADSMVSDTQCDTMCSVGSSMLWQMFDVCYPGIFNPDELSLKEKVIYSICSNEAINFSTKVLAMVGSYTCEEWARSLIVSRNIKSMCELRRHKRQISILNKIMKQGKVIMEEAGSKGKKVLTEAMENMKNRKVDIHDEMLKNSKKVPGTLAEQGRAV